MSLLFKQQVKPASLYSCECGRSFFSLNALNQHEKAVHHQECVIGDECLFRCDSQIAYQKGKLVGKCPLMVVPLVSDSEKAVFPTEVLPISALKSDPTIFVVAPSMKKASTFEEKEVVAEPEAFDDDSSCTSEGQSSVDLSSVDLFPELQENSKVEMKVQNICKPLAVYSTLAKLAVRSSIKGAVVDSVDKETECFLLREFADFTHEEVLDWFTACFPLLSDSRIANLKLDGLDMLAMDAIDIAAELQVSQAVAKRVHKEVRLAKRKSLFCYKSAGVMKSGWISTKKKSERKMKRVYGSIPTVEISDVTMTRLADRYFDQNRKTIDGASYGTYPTMDWYAETMLAFFEDAGVEGIRSVNWDGVWQQNHRHGTETQYVKMKNRDGRMKSRPRLGFSKPNSSLTVTFRSHGALQKFMNVNWRQQTCAAGEILSLPLENASIKLEEAYANERLVAF